MSLLWNVDNYRPIRTWFLAKPARKTLLQFFYSFLALPVYFVYPIMLYLLYHFQDPRFLQVLLVPAVTFALCTLLRRLLNRPRPYDIDGFEPLIPKGRQGTSFPSRHTVSVCIITFACFVINANLGGFLCVLAVGICIVRVLAGVHHPIDVLGGIAFAAVCGVIGFFVI